MSKFTVNYTNKDIMDKLDTINQKIDDKAETKLVYGSYAFTFTAVILYIVLIGLGILSL